MNVPFLPPVRDLASGDLRSSSFDWTGLELIEVSHPDDPDFERLYRPLQEEFGPRGEMESRDVIRQRLGWSLGETRGSYHMRYRLIALVKNGKFAGIHDHTVTVLQNPTPHACVHLSHILVAPKWRRTGLAGWLRAFPVADARLACLNLGLPENIPTVLAAEMEPVQTRQQLPRLLAYARGGYRRLDPALVKYYQPDFRNREEIDATGGPQPLPLWLMVRNLDDGSREYLTGHEVLQIVSDLYAVYRQTFSEKEIAKLWDGFANLDPTAHIALQDVRNLGGCDGSPG